MGDQPAKASFLVKLLNVASRPYAVAGAVAAGYFGADFAEGMIPLVPHHGVVLQSIEVAGAIVGYGIGKRVRRGAQAIKAEHGLE